MSKIIDYLPEYLKSYNTLTDVLNLLEYHLNTMETDTKNVLNNSFIDSADEHGIERFENMLNISPLKKDTLDIRKLRVYSNIKTKLPYDLQSILSKITDIVGDNFSYNLSYENYTFSIDTVIDIMEKAILLDNILDNYLPANLEIKATNNQTYLLEENRNFAGIAVCTIKYTIT